jgi:hypothetical protein
VVIDPTKENPKERLA